VKISETQGHELTAALFPRANLVNGPLRGKLQIPSSKEIFKLLALKTSGDLTRLLELGAFPACTLAHFAHPSFNG